MNKYKEKLKHYPIKKKLLATMGVITLMAVVVGIIILAGMQYITSNIKGIFNGPLTNISQVADVKYGLTDLQRAINRILAEGGDNLADSYKTFEQTVEEDVELVTSSVASMAARFHTTAGKNKVKELQDKIAEGEKIRPQIMELLKSGRFEEAYALNYNTYLPIVQEIKDITGELQQIVYANGQEYYHKSRIVSGVLIGVSVVLVILLVYVAISSTKVLAAILTEPTEQMAKAAQLMYQGDMSAGEIITYESDDELGVMAESMRGTMKNLKSYVDEISVTLREIAKGDLTKDSAEITDFLGDFASIKESFVYILKHFNTTLTKIQEASAHVETGSADISKAASDLATGTTEQASAVEELTATVETIADLAEKSAQATQEAYENVSVAVKNAEDEREKMDSLIEAMNKIDEISKEIEVITTSIENIASQTSLLALNASIEAARAGEAGRGFAVVAEHIGQLATDSSKSAVNTRELIAKTMQEISRGSEITESVAEAFQTTITEMQKFADIAKTTNESAKNQADALSQIEGGIEQISGVTQNTAAASQESSAISDELANRAEELDHLVKRFKLYADTK